MNVALGTPMVRELDYSMRLTLRNRAVFQSFMHLRSCGMSSAELCEIPAHRCLNMRDGR